MAHESAARARAQIINRLGHGSTRDYGGLEERVITAGGKDHTVPKAISTATRKLYHKSPAITDFVEFADRGHSLTIDSGWRDVAQYALDWLSKRHP